MRVYAVTIRVGLERQNKLRRNKMGRPLKKRYFLKNGEPSDVVKYEGVTVSINANGTGYSSGAVATFSAPQDLAGTTATLGLTITPANGTTAGSITAASITNVGAGYNAAPTVTVTPAPTQSNTAIATSSSFTLTNVSGVNGIYPGMQVTGWAGLSLTTHVASVGTSTITLDKAISVSGGSTGTNVAFTYTDTGTGATFTVGLTAVEVLPNSIQMTAYITTGSSAVTSAIIKQEGARSYLVENNQGRSRVKLVTTDALTAGTAKVIATDSAGATYFVKKFNGRKATLVNRTSTSSAVVVTTTDVAPIGTSATIYTSGVARWTTGTAYTYWENTGSVYAKAIPVVSIATNAT